MIQTHSIILWAKPQQEEFDNLVNKTNNILNVLRGFGVQLSPNYLRNMRKKDAQDFDGTLETLREVLKKGVNREGKVEFPELGYRISFFSSKSNKESAGISILVGVTDHRLKNTLVVNLPQTLSIYEDPIIAEKVVQVFEGCVEAFDPFWGCIGNNVNVDKFGGFWDNSLPTTTHWVNFFGSEITNQLGIAKIEHAPVQKVEKFGNGYVVRLKKTPIDDEYDLDIEMQLNANIYFGFPSKFKT